MGKYYILANPYAKTGTGEKSAQGVKQYLEGEKLEFLNIVDVSKDYPGFFGKLNEDDKLVICGGDGTLNRFVNGCGGIIPKNNIYNFPLGTGNDFTLDLGYKRRGAPILINKYLTNLPYVEVKGEKHLFLNNVAFGIDSWVCEVADAQKAVNPKAKTNYTTIALKGLLGAYSPCNAKITVDGKSSEYKKVWMAPTMNGRFFGGGMMVTPNQDRMNPKRTITLMIFHNGSRFHIATGFPSIFSGKHVNNPRVLFFEGNEIIVEYDEPRAVQIDGETVLGVTKYRAVKN
ncbi:MAG: diacylglycerol/lipid kinase family protein [Lachnospiraceae bacterium]|jgi:diacylglycerol kinase (ATP)